MKGVEVWLVGCFSVSARIHLQCSLKIFRGNWFFRQQRDSREGHHPQLIGRIIIYGAIMLAEEGLANNQEASFLPKNSEWV